MQDQKELSALWSKLIKKSWEDESFKQRLLNNPEEVFKEYNIEVPEGTHIKVVEAPLNTKLIHLPPKQSGELLDSDLDKISAAGGGNWYRG